MEHILVNPTLTACTGIFMIQHNILQNLSQFYNQLGEHAWTIVYMYMYILMHLQRTYTCTMYVHLYIYMYTWYMYICSDVHVHVHLLLQSGHCESEIRNSKRHLCVGSVNISRLSRACSYIVECRFCRHKMGILSTRYHRM